MDMRYTFTGGPKVCPPLLHAYAEIESRPHRRAWLAAGWVEWFDSDPGIAGIAVARFGDTQGSATLGNARRGTIRQGTASLFSGTKAKGRGAPGRATLGPFRVLYLNCASSVHFGRAGWGAPVRSGERYKWSKQASGWGREAMEGVGEGAPLSPGGLAGPRGCAPGAEAEGLRKWFRSPEARKCPESSASGSRGTARA